MVGILLIILACLFWGFDGLIRYPFVERGISPLILVFYEHLLLVFIFSLGTIRSFRRLGQLRISEFLNFFMVGGLGSAIATVAFTDAFFYLNPSLVILLQKLQPVVAIMLAALVLREPVHGKFMFWAGVCLVGGLLVGSPDILRLYDLLQHEPRLVTSDGAIRGYLLASVSIFGWASATVFGKVLSNQGHAPREIMAGRFLLGFICLAPFVPWGRSLILPHGSDYLKIALMVVISGALALWFYYNGLRRISARATAIAEMFFPLFAVILNWIFLGKELSEIQILGGGVLMLGSLVIQIKKY